MSFLNRMMASIGIGAARVDTRLESDRVRAGDQLRGVIYIRGGSVEQRVENIDLFLMTDYLREKDDRRVRERLALARHRATGAFTIGPGEEREVPFAIPVPAETPVTIGGTHVWLMTGLDVPMAVDPTDRDYLEVLPHPHAQVVLDAISRLGFRLRKAECEHSYRMGRRFPFIQEFEFVPSGRYRGRFDEVEVVPLPDEEGVTVYMEVDRRARGLLGMLEEALDADERRLRFRLDRADLARGADGVAQTLAGVLDRYSR